MVEAEAAFKADLEKLLKNEGHMPEDKFLAMSRKGKRHGINRGSPPRLPLGSVSRCEVVQHREDFLAARVAVGGRLKGNPCLQHANEGHSVVDALGRTSYTPQPKVPRGISEPRSAGARLPMPWAGFLLLGILAFIHQPQPDLRHVR